MARPTTAQPARATNLSDRSRISFAAAAMTSSIGNGHPNQILGRRGNDSLVGGGGNDTLVGGRGHDTLLGQGGNDVHRTLPTANADTVSGGSGHDTLTSDASQWLDLFSTQTMSSIRFHRISDCIQRAANAKDYRVHRPALPVYSFAILFCLPGGQWMCVEAARLALKWNETSWQTKQVRIKIVTRFTIGNCIIPSRGGHQLMQILHNRRRSAGIAVAIALVSLLFSNCSFRQRRRLAAAGSSKRFVPRRHQRTQSVAMRAGRLRGGAGFRNGHLWPAQTPARSQVDARSLRADLRDVQNLSAHADEVHPACSSASSAR